MHYANSKRQHETKKSYTLEMFTEWLRQWVNKDAGFIPESWKPWQSQMSYLLLPMGKIAWKVKGPSLVLSFLLYDCGTAVEVNGDGETFTRRNSNIIYSQIQQHHAVQGMPVSKKIEVKQDGRMDSPSRLRNAKGGC